LTQFKIDYTFWMNLVAIAVVGGQLYLRCQHRRMHESGGHGHDHDHGGEGLSVKRLIVYLFIAVLAVGIGAYLVTGGAA
jgi:hypothetical protein